MKTPSSHRTRRKEAGVTFKPGPPKPFGEILLEARIPSRLSLKNELILKVLATLEQKGLATDKASLARWRLCLDEALVNAIVHGNNGDPRRFVSLKLMSGKQRWGVIIEDEGKGFNPSQLTQANSPHALYSESGRGILIMRQFADDVRYYRNGSAVMLVKSIPSETPSKEAVQSERRKQKHSGKGGEKASGGKDSSGKSRGGKTGKKKAGKKKSPRKKSKKKKTKKRASGKKTSSGKGTKDKGKPSRSTGKGRSSRRVKKSPGKNEAGGKKGGRSGS